MNGIHCHSMKFKLNTHGKAHVIQYVETFSNILFAHFVRKSISICYNNQGGDREVKGNEQKYNGSSHENHVSKR